MADTPWGSGCAWSPRWGGAPRWLGRLQVVVRLPQLLTPVEVLEIFGFVVARVPGMALAVLAGFNDEDDVSAVLILIVIVVCISLHGCLLVSLLS